MMEQQASGPADGQVESLHARLVAGIRDIIVRGELADGAKVPETALCQRFAVSRTPLREALKALANEGLVTLLPNRGAVVAPLEPPVLAEVFEAKEALERFIGLAAAERADDADLTALEAIHADLCTAANAQDTVAYTDLNAAFHNRIAAAARNGQVQQIYASLQSQVCRARHAINHNPERIAASLAEHEGIMAALRVRARFDLADRLSQHNAATARAILGQFGADYTNDIGQGTTRLP
ncbi:GntR family transcriptional regulator [Oceanibium sediminis]|uniref:GntR family transcriptional regulator n=1 Tax=Oceanibium sediminis TaxID=2026339 RepID=UPI001E53FDB8|nr:GntR family transcriptional regulator [Oceanibium sediminis]